jgi:hypothetical protein
MARGTPEGRNATWGGLFGIVTGVLIIGSLVAFLLIPSTVGTAQLLANWNTYAGAALYAQIVLALLATVTIPFAVALRNELKWKNNTAASAAAILFIIGTLLLALLINLQVSVASTMSGVYRTGGANQAIATAVANSVLLGASGAFNVATLLTGVGFFLFGFAMLNSKTFPNWVADVAVVAAIANFVSLLPALSTALTVVGFVVGLIWVFSSAGYLLRAARAAAGATAPTPT